MKPLSRLVLLLSSFILLATCPIWSQQADTISQLKEQIAKLESVERDSDTPPEVKNLNHDFLTKKRTQLLALLNKRINALRQYQANVGSSLSSDEINTISNSIQRLETDLQKLEVDVQSNPGQQDSASQVAASNLLASTRPLVESSATGYTINSIAVADSLQLGSAGVRTRSATSYSILQVIPSVQIIAPSKPAAGQYFLAPGSIDITFQINNDPNNAVKEVYINASQTGGVLTYSYKVKVDSSKKKQTEKIKLLAGENRIDFYPVNEKGVADTVHGDYYPRIQCDGDDCSKGIPLVAASPAPSPSPTEEKFVDRFSSIYTRGLVGFEQVGASAASSEQKPFMELFWNPPIWTKGATPEQTKTRTKNGVTETYPEPAHTAEERAVYPIASLWGSVRLTSTPKQSATPLATFATSLVNTNESKINDLVQSFDFLVGFEKSLYRQGGHIGTITLPTAEEGVVQKHSGYLIAGFGAISPLNPRSTTQIFARPTNPADLQRIVGNQTLPDTIKYIAFVSPDRQQFFRQYYAGFRIKTYYFRKSGTGTDGKDAFKVINRPGAMFDITVGQNEAVTGGRFIGAVLRLDGFYPITISDKSIFYVFGTSVLNLKRRPVINDPLILETAPSTVTIPNANVFVVTSPQSNRDYYRLGFGVNLVELFKGKTETKQETAK